MSEALDQDLSSDTGFTALTDPTPQPAPDPDQNLSQGQTPDQDLKQSQAPSRDLSWEAFVRFCREEHSLNLEDSTLGIAFGDFKDGEAVLACLSRMSCDRLAASEVFDQIKKSLAAFCGQDMPVRLIVSEDRHKTKQELREEAQKHPKVLLLQTQLNAGLLDCRDTRE